MASERRNITQPDDWWRAWEQQAAADGMELSAWIGRLINKTLPKAVRESLSVRVAKGRPVKVAGGEVTK